MSPALMVAVDEATSTLGGIAALLSFLIEATVDEPKLNEAMVVIERLAEDGATKLDTAAQPHR